MAHDKGEVKKLRLLTDREGSGIIRAAIRERIAIEAQGKSLLMREKRVFTLVEVLILIAKGVNYGF